MSTVFPKWTNHLPTMLAIGGLGGLVFVIGIVWYYFTPEFWEVGYMPEQPGGGFSHQVHVGKLGMDCRYCHTHVEESPEANIPHVSVCMGCHTEGRLSVDVVNRIEKRTDPLTGTEVNKVAFIREAYENDQPIRWRRVHKLPDYVRNFPHNVHVNAGVSCYSCHGNTGRMPVIYQKHSISMSWCLDCHRQHGDMAVTKHLVEPEQVTDLFAVEDTLQNVKQEQRGEELLEALKAHEGDLFLMPDNCGACHY